MSSPSTTSPFSNQGSSDPSDPSNFSTPLSPPNSPRRSPSSSCAFSSSSHNPSSSPNLPVITHSLLQTSLSLKRDFRFLKLTFRESNSHGSSLQTALIESETQKLLQTSLNKLNLATRRFVRDANTLLDEEVNRSFDAYLHGGLRRGRFELEGDGEFGDGGDDDSGSDSGYSSPESSEGWDDEIEAMMMSTEEKETRRELKRLLGVVEELRGVFFKKAGKYLMSAKEREGGEEKVEELVNGRLVGADGEGDDGDDVGEGLEGLVKRLGKGKERICRL